MDADERDICNYLKSWPGQFVSGREIARRASGKFRFRQDPDWASGAIGRLVERDIIESDSTGHYRLIRKALKDNRSKKWISPAIRTILKESGKDFGEEIKLDDDDDRDEFI
jgi:hypothetical protein